jgi:hypothetical protein
MPRHKTRAELEFELRCPRCEYSLLGVIGVEDRNNFAVTCPECGRRVTQASIRRNPEAVPPRIAPFVILPGVGIGFIVATLMFLLEDSAGIRAGRTIILPFGILVAVVFAVIVAVRMTAQRPPAGVFATFGRRLSSFTVALMITILIVGMSGAICTVVYTKLFG